MKKIAVSLLIIFASSASFAQSVNDFIAAQRNALKADKKTLVAESMNLSEAESTVFWPLYDEYNEKTYALKSQTFDLLIDYANNYLSMDNEKAVELWNNKMKIDSELLSLQKTYLKKFLKVLPGETVVRYFQVENKISMIVNAELADLIPLIRQ